MITWNGIWYILVHFGTFCQVILPKITINNFVFFLIPFQIQDASFVWDPVQKTPIVSNISMEIPTGIETEEQKYLQVFQFKLDNLCQCL